MALVTARTANLRQRHTEKWKRNLKQAAKKFKISETTLVEDAVYQYIENQWVKK